MATKKTLEERKLKQELTIKTKEKIKSSIKEHKIRDNLKRAYILLGGVVTSRGSS